MYLRPTYGIITLKESGTDFNLVHSKDKDRKKGPYLSDIFPNSGGTSTGSVADPDPHHFGKLDP
jgi:hypothetical protein